MSPWFSHFNPTPSFPPYTGRYQVGSVDVEVAAVGLEDQPSSPVTQPPLVPTVAFRCFYPCDPPSKPSQPVYWVQSPQKSVLSAYARFIGANPTFSDVFAYFPRLLYWIRLPVHRDAPILAPSAHENKRWPVLVFSHGLGGSRNSYSHLCASLASHGIVVVAAEHRDGSGPISYVAATKNTPATTVDYKRLSHKASKEVYGGRDEQVRIRVWELKQIYNALTKLNLGQNMENLASDESFTTKKPIMPSLDVGSMFHNILDILTPGRVIWAGHSFGAATTVLFLKSIYYPAQGIQSNLLQSNTSASLKSQITPKSPTILLDLWTLPLNSPSWAALKAKPMPCFDLSNKTGGAGTLAVLSEAFAKWSSNLRDVKATLHDPSPPARRERPGTNMFYPLKSAHLSQSDFGILFPRLTKYMAKADEPERTLKLNIRAILQVLRNAGIDVAETSAEDLEVDEKDAVVGASDPAQTSRHGDWKILSKDEGTIRGWVALSVDDIDDLAPGTLKPHSLPNGHATEAQSLGDSELRGADTPVMTSNNRL